MTKLKSASDWATERVKDDNPKLFELFIADIQQNAIEATLEVAANETTKFEYNTPIISPTTLQNKKKILSLINHPNLKL